MDEKNQNSKISKKQILDFIHTPKGKALAFFGVYVVFFLGLSLAAHIGGRGTVLGSTDLKLKPFSYDLSSIETGNYYFEFQVNTDQTTLTYTGKHYNNLALFSDGVTDFYQKNNILMRLQDGIWVKTDSLYPLYVLSDVSIIDELFDMATYVSKTELASGEETIKLEISTTTLVKLLDGIEVDLDDPVNSIEFTKNKDGMVVQIIYELNSYAKYKGLAMDTYRLSLNYSDFGDVSEFDEPA